MRSAYKRVVERCRSWRNIQHAYKPMAQWMKKGSDKAKKLKRFIQRHLELPRGGCGMDPSVTHDIFCEFGYYYILALLAFASDEMQKGM